MSKDRDRTVFRRDGEWINQRNDSDRASSVHRTQNAAIADSSGESGNEVAESLL